MNGSTELMETIDAGKLAKFVRFLVGSFRVGDAQDGEILTRGLTALLGSYPEWVVRAVCDPRSGLPATSKFFPTLYEVRTACEARLRPTLEAERQRRIAEANEADKPRPVDASEAAKRKAFIAKWRARQVAAEVVNAPKLHEFDIRKIAADDPRRAVIASAQNAELERLAERNRSTPIAPLGSWRGEIEHGSAA